MIFQVVRLVPAVVLKTGGCHRHPAVSFYPWDLQDSNLYIQAFCCLIQMTKFLFKGGENNIGRLRFIFYMFFIDHQVKLLGACAV